MEYELMSVGERVKYIRKNLNMTQNEFASTLGVSRDALNNIERNRVKNPDVMLHLLCLTLHVSYPWITKGVGDPYVKSDIITQDFIAEYALGEQDLAFITNYIKLSKESRCIIRNLLSNVFEKAPD